MGNNEARHSASLTHMQVDSTHFLGAIFRCENLVSTRPLLCTQ